MHGSNGSAAPGNEPGPRDATARAPQVVLVVDDEEDILVSLQVLLERALPGVKVATAPSGKGALAVMRTQPLDLILSDYKMPGMNGLEFMAEARRMAPDLPRVLITAYPDLDVALRAINESSVENFVTKPFDPGHVVEVVRSLLAQHRAEELRKQSFARSLELLRRSVQ